MSATAVFSPGLASAVVAILNLGPAESTSFLSILVPVPMPSPTCIPRLETPSALGPVVPGAGLWSSASTWQLADGGGLPLTRAAGPAVPRAAEEPMKSPHPDGFAPSGVAITLGTKAARLAVTPV